MAANATARELGSHPAGRDRVIQSVADRVHHAILSNVRAGRYPAGERLTEARLAAELGVSRVPLREVLKRLAAEGVLEVYPNRGAVVRVLTRRDIREFFQMRVALEGLASKLAASRIDETDSREYFSALLESILQPHPDHGGVAFAEHDDQVHGGIVRRSGNQLLVRHWDLLQLPLHRLRHFASPLTWDFDSSMRDHEQVVSAVVAGDGELAQEQMTAHLQRVVARLLLLNQAEFDSVFNPGLR